MPIASVSTWSAMRCPETFCCSIRQVTRITLATKWALGSRHPCGRLRRAPHINTLGKRLYFSRFQLDLETGITQLLDANGNSRAPLYSIRWSDDGGYQWSDEIEIPGGAIGQSFVRVVAHQLGSGYDRVFEVSTIEPIAQNWIAAYVDVKEAIR
jgi:hypothetical protein